MTHAAFATINRRRVALIEKKFGRGLSPAEEVELDRLQQIADDYIEEHWPSQLYTGLEEAKP